MAEFTLRAATQAEAGAIRDLIHEVGINPMALDWRRFVAAVDAQGKMIGCGQLKPHGEVVELASLAVVEEWRGRGVGRALMDHLMEAGPRPLYLMCRSGLGPLYEKFGFRALEIQEMPRYFQRMAKLAELTGWLALSSEHLLVMKLK